MSPPPDDAVRVVVQARPLLPFELAHGATTALHARDIPPEVHIARPLHSPALFSSFDAVYAPRACAPPDALYDAHVAPLVGGLFDGVNATVFAYGQTSAGKSFTMQHVTERVARQVFERRAEVEGEGVWNVTVRVGFVEIYRERIRDLVEGGGEALGVVQVQVRERRAGRRGGEKGGGATVFLDGARERCVESEGGLLSIIREGALVRQTAATGMNASSSRSHSIITLSVQQERVEGVGDTAAASCLSAKLHLVDLAGSERAKRTGVGGERFAEGVEINKGLFALAKVISTLADNAAARGARRHVPYRDSKLTRLLQDSLGGNARTLLIACVSPADTSREETLGTLRYAERAKCICNRPTVNREQDSVEVSDLRAALARARAEIAALANENDRLRGSTSYLRRCTKGGGSPSGTSSGGGSSPDVQVVTAGEDEEVSKLHRRVVVSEDLLEAASRSPRERAKSPLGRLRERGLVVFGHGDGEGGGNEGKKKVETRGKGVNGPRRRPRGGQKAEWNGYSAASTKEKRNLPKVDSSHRRQMQSRRVQVHTEDGFLPRGKSVGSLPSRGAIPRRMPKRAVAFEQSQTVGSMDSVVEPLDFSCDSSGDASELHLESALATSRRDEMRRTFMQRLKQAEKDKKAIDAQRIQLQRKMGELQTKKEKELEELKITYQSRLAGIRSKLADVKRLEAESIRLTKLRDGSDAARRKMAARLKSAEKGREEVSAKLADTVMKAEATRATMTKEHRELAKSERLLRVELRRREKVTGRQEAVISRLRMELEHARIRLNGSGRQNVRRVNSGITPASTSRSVHARVPAMPL